MAGALISKVTQ